MGAMNYRGEQKINLNLSNFANSVIESDMFSFWGTDNYTGFINEILENYRWISNAAISNRIDEYREELLDAINDENSISVVNKLCDFKQKNLVNEMNSFEKGIIRKVRLNNDNYDYFYDLDDGGRDLVYYHNSIGRLIKAILEDYSKKSFVERERAFFNNNIRVIENAIANGKCLKIQINNYYGEVMSYIVRPHEVVYSYGTNYLYLVGFSNSRDNEPIPAAFRLARIIKVTSMSRNGKIKSAERELLNNMIITKGVQYLVGSINNVQICLTSEGVRMYKNIMHLRPTVVSITEEADGCFIYEFDATSLQIQHYFLQFGKEAYVLNNEQLQERFRCHYKDGYDVYNA